MQHLFKSAPPISNYGEMATFIISKYPEEACGFIVDTTFIPAENIADDKQNDFVIDSSEYIKHYRTGKLRGVIHSHTGLHQGKYVRCDPRTPSMQDMISQQATNIPWGIVSCDGQQISDVLWWGLPEAPELLNRPFIHNVFDCYTLIRDYYKQTYNVTLGVYPRPVDWESYDPHLYEKYYTQENMVRVNTPNPGDWVYFRIMSRTHIDHAGIYLGDDKLLHHPGNRLSLIEPLSKWKKHIAYYLTRQEVSK